MTKLDEALKTLYQYGFHNPITLHRAEIKRKSQHLQNFAALRFFSTKSFISGREMVVTVKYQDVCKVSHKMKLF